MCVVRGVDMYVTCVYVYSEGCGHVRHMRVVDMYVTCV